MGAAAEVEPIARYDFLGRDGPAGYVAAFEDAHTIAGLRQVGPGYEGVMPGPYNDDIIVHRSQGFPLLQEKLAKSTVFYY